jgi:hypothetical protein
MVQTTSKDVEKNSHSLLWECKIIVMLENNLVNMHLPYYPENKFLSIYLYKKLKIYVHTKTYTQMFIAVLWIKDCQKLKVIKISLIGKCINSGT